MATNSNKSQTKTKKAVYYGRPMLDRVLVRQAPAEEKSAGGIIIPENAQEKPQRGEIVAVGNGRDGEPVSVNVGDIVLYGKYAGIEIKIKGEDFLIMKEADLLMVLPD